MPIRTVLNERKGCCDQGKVYAQLRDGSSAMPYVFRCNRCEAFPVSKSIPMWNEVAAKRFRLESEPLPVKPDPKPAAKQFTDDDFDEYAGRLDDSF